MEDFGSFRSLSAALDSELGKVKVLDKVPVTIEAVVVVGEVVVMAAVVVGELTFMGATDADGSEIFAGNVLDFVLEVVVSVGVAVVVVVVVVAVGDVVVAVFKLDGGDILFVKSLLAKMAAIVDDAEVDVGNVDDVVVLGLESTEVVLVSVRGLFGNGGGFLDVKKLAELELSGTFGRVNFDRLVLKDEL